MTQIAVWALLLGIFALLAIWIVGPLFRSRGEATHEISAREEEIDRLIEEKIAVYRSMLDLEFDHRVGKVSDSDYAIMRRQHESEAMGLLKKLDATSSREVLVDVLEKEIASARRRMTSDAEESS